MRGVRSAAAVVVVGAGVSVVGAGAAGGVGAPAATREIETPTDFDIPSAVSDWLMCPWIDTLTESLSPAY
jgi:hypothetical protein